ncbi:MAG: trigger factor [Clostridia bacterium]|nr:trigger factor [Clostridia bacterium]
MSYTVEKISSNKVKLTFTVPADEFAASTQKAYLKMRGRINVPGFRKGKAPRTLIERMYGPEVFYEDAINLWLPEQYDKAIEEGDIRAVDQPEVDVDWANIAPGSDVTITCEVFVYPEVTLGEYKGLAVEIEHETVSDADIDARIMQDRTKHSRTEEVLDRPVQEGDTVNLDYAGTVDGVAFDGGTAQGQTLEIGSHQFIPGFEEQMVGMCVAEEKDLDVTFPENYHAENLAGKKAVFHVKVNSISKTEIPEADDEFAADVSDFTTFADYRQSIVDELQKKADDNNRTAAENAVVEKAADNASVDIPVAMVTREVQNILRDMQLRMAYQGIKMEDYLKWTGQTVEQLAEQYRGEAERRLKIRLVLEAVQKAESIEPDEADVEKETEEQAKRMERDLEDFRKSLTDDQKQALKDAAAVTRTVALMMADAKVTDKPAKTEEPAKEENKADDAE